MASREKKPVRDDAMNLDILSVILLSIIQGFLEWWPVSSQGQLTLIVLQGIADPVDALSIALVFHLGTMFVVLVIFRDKFISLIRPPVDKWFWKYLLLTTLGTALTGIPLLLLILFLPLFMTIFSQLMRRTVVEFESKWGTIDVRFRATAFYVDRCYAGNT